MTAITTSATVERNGISIGVEETTDGQMHRRVLDPGRFLSGAWVETDVTGETEIVKDLCAATWTVEAVARWKSLCQSQLPTSEELWRDLRARRDRLLAACDYTQLPDVPDGDTKAAWAIYRQALRDLPEHTTDPASPSWPAVPAG